MIASEETCEDFSGDNCEEIEVDVSELVDPAWIPVVVGKPVCLFYVDSNNELFFHSLAGDQVLSNLINDMEDDRLSAESLEAVSASQSLVLSDPNESFTILTNLTVSDLGLEAP